MNLLKNKFIPLQVVLFFLLLLSSSNIVFSANSGSLVSLVQGDQQELKNSSLVGEQVDDLFDSILPLHKNLLFGKGNFNPAGDFDALILNHTTTSLNYIKRSRYVFPRLGVKEVIYPFHVFL